MKPDLVAGSHLWQTVFVSFAIVLWLFEVLRGWRLGLPRQLVRIAAAGAGYLAAVWGGRVTLPLLRPFVRMPDFLISLLGGAILALLLYGVITTIGTILFKRTDQQEARVVRLIYGVGGACVGMLFGTFLLCLLVVGIRSLGAISEAGISARTSVVAPHLAERSAKEPGPTPRTRTVTADESSLPVSLARLKKSIELGSVGSVVKQADRLPSGIYDRLTKVGEVFAQPGRAARFLSYPGVRELADHPKILALRADPEIARMLRDGRLLDLVQDQRLIETANDPELARKLKAFDLKGALDYALK